ERGDPQDGVPLDRGEVERLRQVVLRVGGGQAGLMGPQHPTAQVVGRGGVDLFDRDAHRTASRAWARSSSRSSIVSSPTASRTSAGSTSFVEPATDAWVIR